MNYLDILNKYGLYYEAGQDREIAEAIFNGKTDRLDLEDPRVKSILAVYELDVNKNEEKFMELSKEVRASENMDAEFNLFNYVLKNKNYTLAENILGELERVEYRLPYVMLSYGNLYSDQDNIEKAIEYYLKAIEMGCEIANLNLASLYIRIKKHDESIEYLKTLNIDIPMTNYLLGLCYINIKNDAELDNILNNTNIGNYSELLRGFIAFNNPETIEEGIKLLKIAIEKEDIMDSEKKISLNNKIQN
jgi:tetratricopeptide (TPR) repeat protein